MDFQGITERYYDKWLGADGAFGGGAGVSFVYSAERNVRQYGYPRRFDVYALARPGRVVVSYGDGAADRIDALRAELGGETGADVLKRAVERVWDVKPAHSVKFVYAQLPDMATTARPIAAGDMERYIEFWAAAHPDSQTGWIRECYAEIVAEGNTFAAFAGDRIVSCADAPGMPYMADEVQEIGAATLPEFRRQGYALDACVAAARTHIDGGKCPLWSAAWDNIPSHRLAERAGFKKYADAVMLSLE